MTSEQDLQNVAMVIGVLNRTVAIDALTALRGALQFQPSENPLSETAICVDSNVFMRIARHARYDLVADYLTSKHNAPLILPGQAVQEFWNNQHDAITTQSQPLKTSLGGLRTAVSKLGTEMEDGISAIAEAVERFDMEHGHLYDQATITKVLSMLDMLRDKAVVPFAPRDLFFEMVRHRKATKTPPGFKDDGDGDFFIWVDLLFGLISAKREGKHFGKTVLVTNETKKDWCRKNVAHPILVAEAVSLLQVPFEIWDLPTLIRAIENDV